MTLAVTDMTEGNQILLVVSAQSTPWYLMVNFQARHSTANLALPLITVKDRLPQFAISLRIETNP
jgi:hypothetical protein